MVPGRFDLTGTHAIYSGSDWDLSFGACEDGGRVVDDLVLTSGSTTATSLTAVFTTHDTGRKIATSDGTGITDGVTMTYVSATQITLSTAANATGTFVASIRSLNGSAYTAHKAQLKRAEGRAALFDFTLDKTREAVGWYVWSVPKATTESLASGTAVWDWRVDGPEGRTFWLRGGALVQPNVTE